LSPLRRAAEDQRWMRRALNLAGRAAGDTNPNPLVGCVIVKAGRVVGEGFHARAGGPHAEIVALARAGRAARGASLYVNLEPCCHHGRTPPCAPLIVAAGVRRVVAAVRDPNPLVNGRGLALLRRAGISVRTGVLAAEALLLNERFVVSSRLGRPFVLLKAAVTLDGRIATASGDSKWITGPSQRKAARQLRRLHDAVLVGIGTVLADDPRLLPTPAPIRPFQRVVLDSHLRIPVDSRLVRSARRSGLWVLCRGEHPRRRRRLEAHGVRVFPQRGERGRVSLRHLLKTLWAEGLRSLMVEGGSEVLGAFLAERRFDQLALFRAPLLLGGRGSLPAFGGPNPMRISEALQLTPLSPLLKGRGRSSAPAAAPPDAPYEVWYPVTGA
jgi:diaminohydroxyphosphoribosylaminopyrimidine deaminase/5-amino-6-(5-phosphoribosylamino)uracil reductase